MITMIMEAHVVFLSLSQDKNQVSVTQAGAILCWTFVLDQHHNHGSRMPY